MNARNSRGLAAHWEWLVFAVGALMLAFGVVALFSRGPDAPAEDDGPAPRAHTVAEVDLAPYRAYVGAFEQGARLVEPSAIDASYLASERRVFCEQGDPASEKKACGRPIPFGVKVCPYADCGVKQPEEIKVEVDTDADGLPDDWEKKYGLNPNDPADADGDLDGDGFTNIEEHDAQTDPADAASHPPYLDSLELVLPLEQRKLPFFFEKAMPLPDGTHRFYFKDPSKKNDYGKKGRQYTPKTGEPIGDTGFVVKGYASKSKRVEIAGDKNARKLTKVVDVSEATLERKSDKKTLVIAVNEMNKSVDVRAKLVFARGETKEFLVVPGDTIDLRGEKYKVLEIKQAGKTVTVTVGDDAHGKKTLTALEP